MNVERFHALARAVRSEMQSAEVTPLVEQLNAAIHQVVQEPAEPGHQQTLSNLRGQLDTALRRAPSNAFSPVWRQALDELKLTDLVGDALRARIESIFERNKITPSAAAEELAPIAEEVRRLDEALNRVLSGFEFFEIGAEELAPGEFEIGFVIPREAVDEELSHLGREFVKLHRILGPFLELSTGTRDDVRLRSISSSEFGVFLDSLPATALVLATALERLISGYEKVMNIRVAYKALEDSEVSETTLRAIESDAERTMGREIERIVDDLLAGATMQSVERTNELRTELTQSLNALANRIDHGYSVEVRAGVDADDDPEAPADDPTRAAALEILRMQERLRFANLTGQPILELPEGNPGDVDSPLHE